MRSGLMAIIMIIFWHASALASSFFVYEGFLTDSEGNPIGETGSVDVPFILEIRGKTPALGVSCALYTETHTIPVKKGRFIVTVGRGADSVNPSAPDALKKSFSNQIVTIGACSFNPAESGSYRALHVTVNGEALGELSLGDVPRAMTADNADSLNGFKSESFLRVVDGSTPVSLSPWSVANYDKLTDLVENTTVSGGHAHIGGNAAGFTGVLAGDVTGTQALTKVERLQGRNVSGATPANGQVLAWNNANSRWEPSTPAAGGGPAGDAGGDLAGTYPNPSLADNVVTAAKISDGSVTAKKLQAGTTGGQTFVFNGADWQITKLHYRDLVNNLSFPPWPLTECSAQEVIRWSSTMDAFVCAPFSVIETDPSVQEFAKNTPGGEFDISSGKLSLMTLPIAKGGTGQTTATAALNALLPAQAGQGGRVLGTDGSAASWIVPTNGTVTNVTGSAPISVTGGTSTPVITLTAAGIKTTHLGDGAVSSAKILDGTIASVDIADAAVTDAKIQTLSAPKLTGVIDPARLPTSVVFNGGNPGAAMEVGTSDPYSLSLVTNGQKRLHVDPAGNVGINTIAPSANLEVAGSAKISSLQITSGAVADRILVSDATGAATWRPSDFDFKCPSHMIRVDGNPGQGLRPYCIDKYDSMTSNGQAGNGSVTSYESSAGSCLGRGYNLCSVQQYIRACGPVLSGVVKRWTSIPAAGGDVFVVGVSGGCALVGVSTNFTYLGPTNQFRCCTD